MVVMHLPTKIGVIFFIQTEDTDIFEIQYDSLRPSPCRIFTVSEFRTFR